ncbi:Protein of unknown function [Pyronema omphalodes CBS 100304]|uniref:Uncharacterized protein n=1 Tax=Pyronema omphalodes (strain CBS 100304) TaxID=1076935 RepID=U4L9V3_PYROM|nr:Protein of unknown function [Pyronema omphalodes CBS 100304]
MSSRLIPVIRAPALTSKPEPSTKPYSECKIVAGAEIPWSRKMQRTDGTRNFIEERINPTKFPAEIQRIIGMFYAAVPPPEGSQFFYYFWE